MNVRNRITRGQGSGRRAAARALGTSAFLVGIALATGLGAVTAAAVADATGIRAAKAVIVVVVSYAGTWLGALVGRGLAALFASLPRDGVLRGLFMGAVVVLAALILVGTGVSPSRAVDAAVSVLASLKAIDAALNA